MNHESKLPPQSKPSKSVYNAILGFHLPIPLPPSPLASPLWCHISCGHARGDHDRELPWLRTSLPPFLATSDDRFYINMFVWLVCLIKLLLICNSLAEIGSVLIHVILILQTFLDPWVRITHGYPLPAWVRVWERTLTHAWIWVN